MLVWGILGALVLRTLFIVTGITLMQNVHWLMYAFGTFLICAGLKTAVRGNAEIHPGKNHVIWFARKLLPVSDSFHDGKFFVREGARLLATPLFVALVVVESLDIFFATDSIPAVFSITLDPFIVLTSNIFAILALRSLYFVLTDMLRRFSLLHYGVSMILFFAGCKMLFADVYPIAAAAALGVVVAILVVSVSASLKWTSRISHRQNASIGREQGAEGGERK